MAAATDYINEVLAREETAADWVPASSIAGVAVFGGDDDRSRLYETLGVGRADRAVHLAEIGSLAAPEAQFDVVTAGLDAIHRADRNRAASDLLRLCRPGGRIGLACAVPGSFLAAIDTLIDKYVNGPAGQRRRFNGTRAALNEAFAPYAVAMGAADRSILLCYESPEHWLDEFRVGYEPLRRAWQQVSPAWRRQFSAALLETATSFAKTARFGIVIPCEYLEFTVRTAPLQ